LAYLFNELSVVHEGALVLDVVGGDPCLDLVAKPLQLLDLLLEVGLILFLLVYIRRGLDLF
jgi:hypothetical protein